MMSLPKITFGIIVLNGEPFTRYNLRALYPFAHEIIVVEGSGPTAAFAATGDGHSSDGTLDAIRRFKREEDAAGKVTIVTAEDEGFPNGFWPGEKDEQSQAYARRATGDWVWQIDIDEFYRAEDMLRICDYLRTHPETSCLTFNAHHFWGGGDYVTNGGIYWSIRFQGEPYGAYRRLFRWQQGYRYLTHRPPTIVDADGRDVTRRSIRNGTRDLGVHMYHYFWIFAFQMRRKSMYYESHGWKQASGMVNQNERLLERVDLSSGLNISNQFGTKNWLERFTGAHPAPFLALRADIESGKVPFSMRDCTDVDELVASAAYRDRVARQRPIEHLRVMWHHLHARTWLRLRLAATRNARSVLPTSVVSAIRHSISRK